uniref:Uncharacterized protein n=1 Tax=Arundo donax TaxID=35708 RepID=A0A0A8YYI7_ARUDO
MPCNLYAPSLLLYCTI